MKLARTLLKWLAATGVTALLGACAVVPAGGGYGGYGHGHVQGQVYVSPAPVYVSPPAVVVRPAPFYLGGGWGHRGRGGHGGHHGGRH
ncbi:MAG: hypothetical protein IPG42_14415 [Betaproteobacteria bacterium]|jgi:hypothetical protein|nr:hypothetical protein [Betaproteobacteria bacterium]MBK7654488.1 hypothetical protein [Betaproteobacteria bacterium]